MITIRGDLPAARTVAAGGFNWVDAPASWKVAVRELAVAL